MPSPCECESRADRSDILERLVVEDVVFCTGFRSRWLEIGVLKVVEIGVLKVVETGEPRGLFCTETVAFVGRLRGPV